MVKRYKRKEKTNAYFMVMIRSRNLIYLVRTIHADSESLHHFALYLCPENFDFLHGFVTSHTVTYLCMHVVESC